MPSLTPSQSPSTQPSTYQPDDIEGFVYLGVGYCTDAQDSHFDYYVKNDVGTNSECAALCGEISIKGLVGFSLERVEGGRCVCWMNNNIVTSVLPLGFDNHWAGNSGAGSVVSLDTSKATYICFKVEVSNV